MLFRSQSAVSTFEVCKTCARVMACKALRCRRARGRSGFWTESFSHNRWGPWSADACLHQPGGKRPNIPQHVTKDTRTNIHAVDGVTPPQREREKDAQRDKPRETAKCVYKFSKATGLKGATVMGNAWWFSKASLQHNILRKTDRSLYTLSLC